MSVDDEVESIVKFCNQVGFEGIELHEIFSPLDHLSRRERLKKRTALFILILGILYSIYCLFSLEFVQWHASAIGRILMIKWLSFWDWTVLFNKRCLVENNGFAEPKKNFANYADCDLCELGATSPTDFISSTSYDEILNHYLIKSVPVIVKDGNSDWINYKMADFDFVESLLKNENLQDSNPCNFKTSLRLGDNSDLRSIFDKLAENNISNWYFHMQNCDLRAVKVLRMFTPRPYFVSPHVPPAHFNWLLMSKKYLTSRYKPLELDPGLVIISQLKGNTHIRLSSKFECENFCPKKKIMLQEGNTLVLSNHVWNFEYMPDENELNVAILTETEWNDI